MGFELGEGHFNRVQIRRVLGQEEHPRSPCSHRGFCLGTFVNVQIIEDHDVAAGERGRQLCFDINVERIAIHWAGYDPGRRQLVVPQASDEGLGAPFAKRRIRLETLSPFCPTTQPRHLGIDGGLVDEHQAARFTSHPGLPAIDPDPAPLGNISACAFRCHQLFFYM